MPDYTAITEAYRRALPPGKSSYFRIDPIDYLGTPIVHVNYQLDGGKSFYSIGYGATEAEALLGAFGELSEKIHLAETFGRGRLSQSRRTAGEQGSYRAMTRRFGTDGVLDPLTLVLPAGSPYDAQTELQWMEIERLADGAFVWCPIEFVSSFDEPLRYPNQLTTAITNGNGAGDSLERAMLHGTLELLQRDGNADAFRALDRGIVLATDSLPEDARHLIAGLRDKGLEVVPKLARTTCGSVSLYAVGIDHSDDDFALGVTACGEAADPDYPTALRKAILECASSHSRKRFYNLPFDRKRHLLPEDYVEAQYAATNLDEQEQRALRALSEWIEMDRAAVQELLADNVLSRQKTVPATELPTFAPTDIPSRWAHVRAGVEAENLTPYRFRATTTSGGIEVVKMIVPGIEMELGSYHRIGYRGVRRLLERDGPPLIQREPGPGRARVRLTAEHEEMVGGPAYLDTAKLDALVDPLYALYREPFGHAAAIAVEQNYFATPST